MTQEEKQLLLKDLCAREPYHPRIQVFNQGYEGFQDGEFDTHLWLHHIDAFRFDRIEILPYLRPMSSMTEEERKEYWRIKCPQYDENNNIINTDAEIVDWLIANHFDYRGLIPMGLALEEKKEM